MADDVTRAAKNALENMSARLQIGEFMHETRQKLLTNFRMLLDNLPDSIRQTTVGNDKNNMPFWGLGTFIDNADSAIQITLLLLDRNPNYQPTREDIEDLMEHFKALVFVQEQWKTLRECQDVKQSKPDAPADDDTPWDRHMKQKQKNDTLPVLDIGRHRKPPRKPFRLTGIQQATLDNLIQDLGTYILTAAQLLGVKIKGTVMAGYKADANKYQLRHLHLNGEENLGPPQPWADIMGAAENAKISIPYREAQAYCNR